jgi:hypothetical protein
VHRGPRRKPISVWASTGPRGVRKSPR